MTECPRYLQLTLDSIREADMMETRFYGTVPAARMGVWPRDRRNGYPISGDALARLKAERV